MAHPVSLGPVSRLAAWVRTANRGNGSHLCVFFLQPLPDPWKQRSTTTLRGHPLNEGRPRL